MSRIPYPSMDDLSEVKRRRIFDPARKYILNVSKMALHMPDALWDAQAELGRRATYECEMDPRLREIVVVRIGWLQKSEYELFHHKTIALNAGVTEAELAALQSEDLSIFSPEERALIAYTSEVTMNVSPSDETLAAARACYPDSLLFEVIGLIGSYMMTARLAAVGGVENDEAAVTNW